MSHGWPFRLPGAMTCLTSLTNLSVQWVDPRTRSDAQVLDAATKMHCIEVPWSSIMEFIGYTPAKIAEMEQQRSADTFQRLSRERSRKRRPRLSSFAPTRR